MSRQGLLRISTRTEMAWEHDLTITLSFMKYSVRGGRGRPTKSACAQRPNCKVVVATDQPDAGMVGLCRLNP